jgi:hypothetical protein
MQLLSVLVTVALLALPVCARVSRAAPNSACPVSPYVAPPVGGLQGIATGGSLYAQVSQAVPTDVNEKIVLRVTGTGQLQLAAIGPGGQPIAPNQLDTHPSGSSWDGVVPGDEWGSFWTFPTPGCWDLHAVRGSVRGDIYFQAVVPVFSGLAFAISAPHGPIRSSQKITFRVRPEIASGPVSENISGTITIQRSGKVERLLGLKPDGQSALMVRTRFTVRRVTSFNAVARVTFRDTTLTKSLRFRVLPRG